MYTRITRKDTKKIIKFYTQHFRKTLANNLKELRSEFPAYGYYLSLVREEEFSDELPSSFANTFTAMFSYLNENHQIPVAKKVHEILNLSDCNYSQLFIMTTLDDCSKDFINTHNCSIRFWTPFLLYEAYLDGKFYSDDPNVESFLIDMIIEILIYRLPIASMLDVTDKAKTIGELNYYIQSYLIDTLLPQNVRRFQEFDNEDSQLKAFVTANATEDICKMFFEVNKNYEALTFINLLVNALTSDSSFKVGELSTFNTYCKYSERYPNATFNKKVFDIIISYAQLFYRTSLYNLLMKSVLSDVSNMVDESNHTEATLQKKIASLERSNTKKQNRLDEQTASINKLNTELNKLRREAKQTNNSEVEELRAMVNSLRQENAKYKAHIEALHTEPTESTETQVEVEVTAEMPTVEQEVNVEPSLDEVIDYLNQFRILFIGGPESLKRNVPEYLPNTSFISAREKYGEVRIRNTDLVVIYTTVISHARAIKARKESARLGIRTVSISAPASNKEELCRQIYKYVKPKESV